MKSDTNRNYPYFSDNEIDEQGKENKQHKPGKNDNNETEERRHKPSNNTNKANNTRQNPDYQPTATRQKAGKEKDANRNQNDNTEVTKTRYQTREWTPENMNSIPPRTSGREVSQTRNKTRNKTRQIRKRTNKTRQLKIWYNNINGITSKITSLRNIIREDQPHIIALTETKTKSPQPIEGYKWISAYKPNRAGGTAIAARKDIANNIQEEDSENTDKAEIIWTKMTTGTQNTYIGVYYGKQENEKRETIHEEFSSITTEILRKRDKGNIILIGDFNAKIEINQPNILQKESPNGTALQTMINNTSLIPISIRPNEGIWTRVNRKKPEERSIIDYILVSPEIANLKHKIHIDEEGQRRPRGKNETDHNTIVYKTEIPQRKQKTEKTIWNINEKTDWTRYNECLKEQGKPRTYRDLENNIHMALETTIGTKTIITNKKPTNSKAIREQKKITKTRKKEFNRECKENGPNKSYLYKELIKEKTKLRDLIEQEEKIRITEISEELIKEGGVKSKQFWRLRKKLLRKPHNDYELITENGTTVTDPSQSKEYIAEYFENLYQARQGTEEFRTWTNTIERKYEEMENEQQTDSITINRKELNIAIKHLKNKKATGPDNIPNEAIKEMTKTNRKQVLKIFNNIAKEEEIPEQWTKSRIIRIYKGKGVKGKCSSDRGIALSSNMGKLFERIIDNKTKEVINMTDAQAGGRRGRSTTDHLSILNTIIEHNKKRRKPTYIAFLDVEKAYDKAWNKAIMYVMNKEGVKGNLWKIINKLNKNLTAEIDTKHGSTRSIKIRDSIRQGGVLSVTQYALLMDEISKEIEIKKDQNNRTDEITNINVLLWMDDVALITDNIDSMKSLLKTTDHTAKKYHIEFGKNKSNILKLGKNRSEQEPIKLGDMQLNYTRTYKYLGITVNAENNLKDQIRNIEAKTEAAYQTIMTLLGNEEFNRIEMSTIWKLVEVCIIPVITYGCESWRPNKGELKHLDRILDGIIRRILMTPQGTPRETLYIETNLLDITRIIDKRKLNMYYRIKKTPNSITEKLVNTNETSWKNDINTIMNKYKIQDRQLLNMKPQAAKKLIRKKIHNEFRKIMFRPTNKSKVTYLTSGYIGQEKAKYTNQLSRKETSILFKARTRMTDIKGNYKNKYEDNTCRLCKNDIETQDHIFENCGVTKQNKLEVKKDLLFSQNRAIQKITISKINSLMELMDNQE